MQRFEFVALRPDIERAIGEIDADFAMRKQSLEIARELKAEFDRRAAMPECTTPETKLETITPEEHEQVVLSILGQNPQPPQNPKKLPILGQYQVPKRAIEEYLLRKEMLLHNPPTTRPLFENAYPWRHTVTQVAESLRAAGSIIVATAIAKELSGLPTGPVDGNQPELLKRHLEAIQAIGEQVRTILVACLEEQSLMAKLPVPPAPAPTPDAPANEAKLETPPHSVAAIPILMPDDQKILEHLAAKRPVTVDMYDLAEAVRISRKKVGERLEYLRENKLAVQPFGERQGHTITAAGLQVLQAIEQRANVTLITH